MFRSPRIAPFLALVACGGEAPWADDVDPVDSDVEDSDVAYYPDGVDFELRVGADVVGCDRDLRGLGAPATTMNLVDARMYVSDLVLSGPTSGERALVLTEGGPWQHNTHALLDFEDATSLCEIAGTPATHTRVDGYIADGDWNQLSFTVGLPFEDNHVPLGDASAPLDVVGLYRTAQLGRWSLKLDLRSIDGGPGADFSVDVASEGCASASAQTPPELPCSRPSLARITVPFQPFAEGVRPVVVLDLLELLAAVDLSQNFAGPPGCQSNPDDTYECAPIWATLGMSFGTASCIDDCEGQTAFRTICRSLIDDSEVPCP